MAVGISTCQAFDSINIPVSSSSSTLPKFKPKPNFANSLMAQSKSDQSSISLQDKEIKEPNLNERVEGELAAPILHSERKATHHHKETHGQMTDDIDENTPISYVKGPNVFERAKEEIEAIVQTIHPKKESKSHISSPNGKQRDAAVKAELKQEKADLHSAEHAKAPNAIERAKEELEAIILKKKAPHHHNETHGMSDDIDENTPISEVKGPNIFERAKEEIEALVETIHPKKESSGHAASSPKKEGGFRVSVGKGLEKVCSPFGHKRD